MLSLFAKVVTRQPMAVVGAWIAVVLLCTVTALSGLIGPSVFDRLGTGELIVPGASQEAQELIDRANPDGAQLVLIVQGVQISSKVTAKGIRYSSPEVKRQFDRVRQELKAVPFIRGVRDAFQKRVGVYDETVAPFISDDQQSVLMMVSLRKGLTEDEKHLALAEATSILETVAPNLPGTRGLVGGEDALLEEVTHGTEEDLRRGESIALPISLVVLVLVFGGLLAAGMPIVGALASMACALGGLLLFAQAIELDPVVVNIVSVLGLGLCIDYGLLLVSRYREEARRLPAAAEDSRRGRADRRRAVRRALSSSGRTIVFSGLTVTIALSGLLFFRTPMLQAMGAAGICTVLVAMLVGVTLVPALLLLAGPRALTPGIAGRAPVLGRLMRHLGEVAPAEGAFSRLCRRVQRSPALTVYIVLAVLCIAALPTARHTFTSSSYQLLPADNEVRQVFEVLQEDFSYAAIPPVQVVTRASREQVAELAAEIRSLPQVTRVDPPQVMSSEGTRVTVLNVALGSSDSSAGTATAIDNIRAIRSEEPFGVTGVPVILRDYVADVRENALPAIAVVVLAASVLLFLMTGSLLIPIKALFMNVLSLAATVGIVVWAFQDGALEGLLGFQSVGGLETFTVPIVVAFGFGLAMDYEVFLLARIAENRRNGQGNDEAVVNGLQGSGRIITSAAVTLVVVFVGLLAGRLLLVKEVAFALAISVIVDATLVRMLLVPATMTVLGEWNWWAPPALRRLHARFGLSESGAAAETPPAGLAPDPRRGAPVWSPPVDTPVPVLLDPHPDEVATVQVVGPVRAAGG
jgi:RND superfamily putative drug exporter